MRNKAQGFLNMMKLIYLIHMNEFYLSVKKLMYKINQLDNQAILPKVQKYLNLVDLYFIAPLGSGSKKYILIKFGMVGVMLKWQIKSPVILK